MNTPEPDNGKFPETRWTVVAHAHARGAEVRRAALAELCEIYWRPVYWYARREGCSPEDAEDLTQGFFATLLERGDLEKVREGKGKLRTFLIVSMKHYLANAWKRERRLKRGGGKAPIPLDAAKAEMRYQLAAADETAPDRMFERAWAVTLLDRVMQRLRENYDSEGKGALFDDLKPFLTPRGAGGSYAEAAAGIGLSENAFKVAVHRMRKRYGRLLREEIADTLGPGEDVEEEIRHLFEVFS